MKGNHMSQWEKLIAKILGLSNDLRYEELKKVLESYEYVETSPAGGSSHHTFRRKGHPPITIPRNAPIKRCYVELVRDIIKEESNDEDA